MPTSEEKAASSAAYHAAMAPGLEIDRYWNSVVTNEPVPQKIKQLVRADLIKLWYYERYASYRQIIWLNWTADDGYRVTLGGRTDYSGHSNLKYLWNKTTACYWLQSAQEREDSVMSELKFAAIFEEWIRCDDQNIEFGHFFATPIRITSTGPAKISDIILAHKSI